MKHTINIYLTPVRQVFHHYNELGLIGGYRIPSVLHGLIIMIATGGEYKIVISRSTNSFPYTIKIIRPITENGKLIYFDLLGTTVINARKVTSSAAYRRMVGL